MMFYFVIAITVIAKIPYRGGDDAKISLEAEMRKDRKSDF